jgi:hypothetical protein
MYEPIQPTKSPAPLPVEERAPEPSDDRFANELASNETAEDEEDALRPDVPQPIEVDLPPLPIDRRVIASAPTRELPTSEPPQPIAAPPSTTPPPAPVTATPPAQQQAEPAHPIAPTRARIGTARAPIRTVADRPAQTRAPDAAPPSTARPLPTRVEPHPTRTHERAAMPELPTTTTELPRIATELPTIATELPTPTTEPTAITTDPITTAPLPSLAELAPTPRTPASMSAPTPAHQSHVPHEPVTIARVEDLATAIDRLRPIPKGGAVIEVEPPGLGTMRVEVAVEDGTIRIRIDTDDPRTAQWIEGERHGLTAAARQSIPDATNVELELRQGSGDGRHRTPQREPQPETQRASTSSTPTHRGPERPVATPTHERGLVDVVA